MKRAFSPLVGLLRSPMAATQAASTRLSLLGLLPSRSLSTAATTTTSLVKRDLLSALETRWTGARPKFSLRGDEISVLETPEEFLQTLLALIRRSRRRLVLSTLYIGDGEAELVTALRESLAAHPSLSVTIIVDNNRGTRKPWPQPSTASLLYPFVRDFGPRVNVRLYQSPSRVAKYFPERFREGFGTWHSKIYTGDSEVILTGANLSHNYFTNRQDRYFHFRNAPKMADYLSALVGVFSRFAHRLVVHSSVPYDLQPPLECQAPIPYHLELPSPASWKADAALAVREFQRRWATATRFASRRVDVDTTVWPVVQVGYLGIREEEAAMHDIWGLLEGLGEEGQPLVDLTSGYFALAEGYEDMCLRTAADVRIVAASPQANGFYGSKGISGLIPDGYTLRESEFEAEVRSHGRSWVDEELPHEEKVFYTSPRRMGGRGIEITEWEREGWTYHAKGLWISSTAGTDPCLTMIGSSNLSARSCDRDAEASFFISTQSRELRRELRREVDRIRVYSAGQRVGPETWARDDRRVSWKVKRLIALPPRGLGIGRLL